eukprot:TRINITY_DN27492_c0_g1_i4.p1 TRINITY_DN27492_c0_g1~~TRINITY_DN27492_c0_g1_i4.p1  ORF type:complete len:454 (+),score=138.46 TRINITY_DN27492_c0_g1_i4:95-1363(+)
MRPAFAALPLLAWGGEAAAPFQHAWDTVGGLMAMHGKYKEPPGDASIEFAARNYATITTGTSCSAAVNRTHTLEQSVLSVATRLKAVNPSVKVGMYWRSPWAMELADCSGWAGTWAAHPEFRLRADNGTLIMHGKDYYIDYTHPGAAAFFADVVVNVTTASLPSGAPVLDFVYIDGDPSEAENSRYLPGVGPARSAEIVSAMYACFANIQARLDGAGRGQKVILNGMDAEWEAERHVVTGAAGSMFDHWSILQFVDRHTGAFETDLMAQAIALASSPLLSNVTTQIKGWPGPIVHQRDQYPPNMPTPKTPGELQQVSATRFNSELALFLLVASPNHFWIYSWFWGWDDYVPGAPDSSVPPAFFPEAKCPLGAPAGPATRAAGTWTYRREFEHASVFVDLGNRSASRVAFRGCPGPAGGQKRV